MHAVLIFPKAVEPERRRWAELKIKEILLGNTDINAVHNVENFEEGAEASHVTLLLDCGEQYAPVVERCFVYLQDKFGKHYVVNVRTFAQVGPKYQSFPEGVVAA